jgi:prephenate dehydrogenase
MKKIHLAIIGVGLIGGSLGLALKDKLKDDIYITGLSRTENSMKKALARGAVDMVSSDVEAVVKDADVVFLSTPVLQIPVMVKTVLPYLKKGTIITDAGSTKQYIWQHLKNILPENIYYIAGHPMTGKERSGVMAADKDLFLNKCYVIVEDTGAPKEVLDKITSLIKLTGANLTTLDIAKHDRCASVISHVPHVAAAALVTLLNRSGGDMESCLKLAGGGFKDTTRIASSNSDMWADICMTNSKAIIHNLHELQQIMNEVIIAIEQEDRQAVYDYFANAKGRRDQIIDQTEKMFEI